MNSSSDTTKNIHQGRNVKRFREMLGIKQEGLAYELGEDWTQKRVSLLEQKETIEQDILDQVAKILQVPADAIKNFDEQQAINIISNTFHDTNGIVNYNPSFNINPIDKWVEALEENKKLYERLLKAEQEKNELLLRLLDSQKKNI
ncbi:helix-turn-helix domain-containing protein [Dyadobacter subterraneus]|uniref:Helix-turn-helix transcriptional regulator n=1 Tax=Dyadobacter subterraneus TaxID=2773304 RepID=A0ABR9W6J5_9BACT|nr:helix-turn-helix transcriptional regulator [Dyadobacter subterraneus]MBE9460591.1 helix-turn-helix transcriptional regulator [Dyadobacter subterraneus]